MRPEGGPVSEAPSGGRAAEIITLFEESVLAVKHLAPGERYTVGESAGVDLPLAGYGDRRELLRYAASGAIEVVDASGLTAELLDEAQPLAWVRELPGEQRVASIGVGQRLRLSLGALTILVMEQDAPQRRELPRAVDLRSHATTGVVAILFALFLAAVHAIPPTGASLAFDPLRLDERLRRVAFVPATPPPQERATGGAGDAGVRSPIAHATPTRGSSSRPRPTPIHPRVDAASAKGLAADAAMRSGVLSVLGQMQGSHVAAIFGSGSVLGAEGEAALGHISADATCADCSGYGLGVVAGRGSGRSGEDSIMSGGLARIGGPGGGSGSGVAGGVGAGLRSHHARAPEVAFDPSTKVIGVRDRDGVRRAIRSKLNEIKYCYERELARNDQLAGRVVPRFTIGPDGRVVAAVMEASTIGDGKVDACVLEAVRRIEFPRMPSGSGLTIVSYPFAFQAAGR